MYVCMYISTLHRRHLHRICMTVSSECLYEEGEVIDDAEHAAYECARWQGYHSVLTSIISTITAVNIIGVMIARRENWVLVANYVEGIISR